MSKKATPAFTIITPTYNRPALLARLINSVQSQDFPDWELIIIDDANNDLAFFYIKECLKDTRIKYFKNKENIGAPSSRNKGLDEATGEWISFLDDDDTLAHHKVLSSAHKQLSTTKYPWLVYARLDNDGQSLTFPVQSQTRFNWTKDYLFGRKFRGDAAHFIKRNLIGNIRNYGAGRSEWQFWYELAKKSDFLFINEPAQIGGYLNDGLMVNFVKGKQRLYLTQQLKEVLRQSSTLRFVPVALMRLILNITGIHKLRLWLHKITH
jgi:glycosyltransferase involved in cell wall biosynthesis